MITTHTCDKCGKTASSSTTPIPKGWDRITLESGEAHVLCAPCVADYWEWINEKQYFRSERP